jgi:hypothetical protein
MTVDRSTGANRGRTYFTWNESINFYFDLLGTGSYVVETENNNSAGAADVFALGSAIHGQLLASDVDYWKFNGTQGQTVVLFADTVGPSLDLQTEMLCTDGSKVLSYSENGPGGFTLHVFTLPVTGTYYLRASAWDGVSVGAYTVETGIHVPIAGGGADRARDHRDIFVKFSSDAVSWPGAPKLVSSTPAWFDDYLPEVAVGGNGKPYIAWYDFHDSPGGICAGSGGNTYLTRSDDGGNTWSPGSPVSDTTTVWSAVPSNIEPNMGDYIGLFANATGLFVGWADGRRGSPDVFMANVGLGFTATTVSLVSADAASDRVSLTWLASTTDGLSATVERRTGDDGAWTSVGSIVADGSGRLSYVDTDVVAGGHYGYRLAVVLDGTEQRVGETSVVVPSHLAFALHGARPNPSPGLVSVAFVLPDAASAHLELLDVTGRRVAGRDVGTLGAGSHVVDLTEGRPLAAGVYLVRLSRAGQSLTTRVTVIR